MGEPAPSIRIDAESDEYVVVSVVAVAPTWRDCWAIIRGRYKPQVVRIERTTVAGFARMLKQTWTTEAVGSILHGSSPLRDWFIDKTDPIGEGATAIVPIKKQKGSTDD